MKFFKWLGIVLLLLIIVYFLGPRPATPKYNTDLPAVPTVASQLEEYVRLQEAKHRLKPDNEARIVWSDDSLKQKTACAVLYLHGFSASQEEGDPVHQEFAKKFGCNLFLSRLADHGVDTTEAMANITAEKLWNSAKEAFAISRQLGEKLIIIATSTGGTLALKLAAEFPQEVMGLILLSPNIAINDPNAWLLNNPWGLQIARLVQGKYVKAKDTTAVYAKYWYPKYRMESAVQLEELLETTMKQSTYERVQQPALVLYYYKDEKNQDPVVKVSAMKKMFRQLGTADNLKRMIAVPKAGEHVIGSYIKSKDLATVQQECERFAVEILRLQQ